ncbi:NINE protein [Chitinophagaceae bacterium LWZ2-11]
MSLNLITYIPSIEADELAYIQSITKDLSNDKLQAFITVYNSKRQKSDVILLTTLLGFVGFAGIQRFITGQIGMGIVYFFTAGLCFVGTIIDAINYKKLAFEFNQGMALESMRLIQGF